MTISEMHKACDELLDKSDSPWFNPEQKDFYLNLAQEEFVETRYREFEVNEKRREELISLIRRSTFSNTSIITLSDITDFYYVLSLSAIINDCGDLINKEVVPIQFDDYVRAQQDPFHKSDNEFPGYLQLNDGAKNIIEVKSEDVPESLTMVWLKIPIKVNITIPTNCELPSITHKEIVDIAVRRMMATTENPNYQVQINEINNQE